MEQGSKYTKKQSREGKNTHARCHSTSNKGVMTEQWERNNLLNKQSSINGIFIWEKQILIPTSHSTQKLRCNVIKIVKDETIKLLKHRGLY